MGKIKIIICLMGVIFLVNTAHTNPNIMSANEARKALAALGISYGIDSYFKAVKDDDVNIVKLFHISGVDIDIQHTHINRYL